MISDAPKGFWGRPGGDGGGQVQILKGLFFFGHGGCGVPGRSSILLGLRRNFGSRKEGGTIFLGGCVGRIRESLG